MSSINFDNKKYNCRDGETVLETFLRNGVTVPFSCKDGVCHACLLRSIDNQPSTFSQKGVKDSLVEKKYFKSCTCVPEQDMSISLPESKDMLTMAMLAEKEALSDDVYRLLIEPSVLMDYQSGQFISLHGPDDTNRSYSLASVQHEDYYLELHIKRVPDGKMSNWLIDDFSVGDEINFHGPSGDCFYNNKNNEITDHYSQQELLLISTGTGLAPHIGVVRDALKQGHQGLIKLFHGGENESSHYLKAQLEEISSKHVNFEYILCADKLITPNENIITGFVSQVAFDLHRELDNSLIFISGNPDMVEHAQQSALKLGAKQNQLFSDPFEFSADTAENDSDVPKEEFMERPFPDPDPEMWAALDNGKLLSKILTRFYDQVFVDDIMSPYFVGVTKERLVEKVYSFHYQQYTGEKVFFGERPKNSHHWMVISDEIFDYRENLMKKTLQEFDFPTNLIDRWMESEEVYRSDIVKEKPTNKVLFGEEVPYEGFETLVMEFSSLCDSCESEIDVGDTIRYHTRMGTVYCSKCTETDETQDTAEQVA